MIEGPWGEHPTAPPLAAHWLMARLSVAFVVDIADIARQGGQVIDPLLITAVIEANVAPINQDPALQLRYGTLDTPPPDELRRPVSINAIAASLGLPFETVRRRLNALAAKGDCVITPKGVLVPSARLADADYQRQSIERYERTKTLYFDLKENGGLADMAAGAALPGPALPGVSWPDPQAALAGPPPVRLVSRLLSEYYLRALELLGRRVGDPLTGLVLMALGRANIQDLTPEERASGVLLPEGARKPVRRSQLARQMGLPNETVRRRLLDLEQRGYCQTGREGVIFAVSAAVRPQAQALFHENNVNLMRMMSRLARYGVLPYWDREGRTPVP